MGLKIVVVLPMYGGSLPIGRYCVQALLELGHSISIFEAPALYPAYKGITSLDISPAGRVPLQNSFLRFVSQALWQQVAEQKPQLVLALAQAPIDRHLLQRMRNAGILTVMWFVEDYRLFTYWQIYAPLYDAFAVIQKEPFLSMLAKIGQTHAFYLPLAMLPSFHRHMELGAEDKARYGAKISFLGAGYPNRRKAFAPLASRDFKIWGTDWEGEEALVENIQEDGRRISPEDAVKIYNATEVNLNLHSSISNDNIVGNGDFVNPRTFELAGMGAFQLVDRRSLLPELFGEDDLAVFENQGDMYAKIDYYLEHPEERAAYAKRAQKRALLEHTYEKRMITLLDYMQRSFGLKAPDNQDARARNEKLRNIGASLGLPEAASDEDIIAAMRRKKTRLDGEEVGALFSAEWEEAYGNKNSRNEDRNQERRKAGKEK